MWAARNRNKTIWACRANLTVLVLLAALTVGAEPNGESSGSGSAGDQSRSSEFGSPKRQYLIAPRVGRGGGSSSSSAIWTALEEAAMSSPGQVHPNRGFPKPLKSSLLFLVGNRRTVGPRSGSGLLPQARIGRRAAPIGLLPQPRIGRRSFPAASDLAMDELSGELGLGQQEVATAAQSDNSPFNEALEELMNSSA